MANFLSYYYIKRFICMYYNVLLQKVCMYVLYICYNITFKARVKTTLMYRLILWTEEIRSNSQGFKL